MGLLISLARPHPLSGHHLARAGQVGEGVSPALDDGEGMRTKYPN